MNFLKQQQGEKGTGFLQFGNQSPDELERLMGVFKESREAIKSLEEITWRVNYLVHQDGRTPCRNTALPL